MVWTYGGLLFLENLAATEGDRSTKLEAIIKSVVGLPRHGMLL